MGVVLDDADVPHPGLNTLGPSPVLPPEACQRLPPVFSIPAVRPPLLFPQLRPEGRVLEAARNRHPVDWIRRDVEVSRISQDVAIVTYRYDCKIVLSDGNPLANYRDRRLSMTWVNRKGGWVVVFVQETILPGGE